MGGIFKLDNKRYRSLFLQCIIVYCCYLHKICHQLFKQAGLMKDVGMVLRKANEGMFYICCVLPKAKLTILLRPTRLLARLLWTSLWFYLAGFNF